MTAQILRPGILDVCSPEKESIVLTGWVVNAALDPVKLEQSWAILTQKWPILTSRLRRNDVNVWEYHIPQPNTSSIPPYNFVQMHVAGPINKHFDYHKPSLHISCSTSIIEQELMYKGGAKSAEDLFTRNEAIIQLQLTVFEDASIVTLATPHVLCDGHGIKEIIRSLISILDGNADTIGPLMEHDPFVKYLPPAGALVETPPYFSILRIWEIVILVLYLLWDMAFNRPIEGRTVFMPAGVVQQLKAKAMEDLAKEGKNPKIDWISTSDVLAAYGLKLVHGSSKSSQPFNLAYVANIRKYVPSLFPGIYIHNAHYGLNTPTMPLHELSTMSLGSLSLLIRETIRTQTNEPAITRMTAWRLACSGRVTTFFRPNGAWLVNSSWRDMNLMDVNFAGALPDGAPVRQARCVFLKSGLVTQKLPVRNIFGVIGDDARGGIWMFGYLPRKVWDRVEAVTRDQLGI